ncbi:hypothetical protein MK489_02100 [Myxococcota bacterium]|nr:hypothetical protein [Myxococcota bacterium]
MATRAAVSTAGQPDGGAEMLKSFTFVKMNPGLSRDEFFQRWCEHTRDWDLRDHPEISLNRLTLVEGDGPYAGIAENHWPDQQALDAAAAWYESSAGQEHWADLSRFMDIENSPTVVVTHEADVSEADGIQILASPDTDS